MQSATDSVQHSGAPERRQVTVVFCDLVDSTRIADEVDPEDLHQLYLVYHAICDECIGGLGGQIMEYHGDGILASFGYPIAVEKSTHRAINASLRLIAVVRSTDWSRFTDLPIRVRIGVHTGIVVAGDVSTSREGVALTGLVGAALNLASRLQGLAEPNTVVISEEARVLVENNFVTASLGEHRLKGLSRDVRVHVVHQATEPEPASRAKTASLAPMVGRKQELSELLDGWARAESGAGATICLSGDAGIGKSRLVAEFCRLSRVGVWGRTVELQCSPYYRNSPLYPVVDALGRASNAGLSGDRLGALEQVLAGTPDPEEAVPLLGALVSVPTDGRYVRPALSPEAARKRTNECVMEWLLLRSADVPVLVIVHDIHWIDPTTLDLVQELVARVPKHRAMAVLTFRNDPDERSTRAFQDTETIDLGPLAHEHMEQLVYHVAGRKYLSKEIVDQILQSTGGIPLFGEELTKAVVHSDFVIDHGSHFQANQWQRELEVPPALQDILAVRLDRTGAGRRLAQLASILGRKFTGHVLGFIYDERELRVQLDSLVREGVLEEDPKEPDSFSFRHALIHKAAYESLLKSTRKDYHQRVANVLATHPDSTHAYPPELVAQHFTLGGLPERAIPLWLQAAGTSLRRSANLEARAQAEEGLSCVRELGSPPALKPAELMLQTVKGTALIAARGWGVSEVGEAFARAAAISDTLTGTQHTPALWGLWVHSFMRGELGVARQYAEQILRIGDDTGDSAIQIEGHWTLGATLYWQPELAGSREHLEAAVRMYDPAVHGQNAFVYGQDPGVSARAWLTFVLAFSGHTSAAMQCGNEALELARQVGHPFSTAWAMAANTLLRIELNDVEGALTLGEEALRYCMEQEQAFWVAALLMGVGWAKTRSGDAAEGLAMAEQGFAAYDATGARLIKSFFAAMLTDAHLTAGDLAGAERWLARGFEIAQAQKEEPIVPTLLLLKAGLLLRKGPQNAPEAAAAVQEAVAKAAEQGARLRQLQASTVLAQLLLAGGAADHARQALEPIVTWFQQHGDPAAAAAAIPVLDACRQAMPTASGVRTVRE